MNFRIFILLVLLVGSGCARDEFGTRDSGGTITVPGADSQGADDGINEEPETDPVNNDDGGDDEPPVLLPGFGEDYERVSPAALLAMEAVTRATFTDASASSGNFVFSPLALASTLTVAGMAGDAAMRTAVENRLTQSDLEDVADGLYEAVLSAEADGDDDFVSLPTLWIDSSASIDSSFLETVMPNLIQEARTVDFSSVEQARQTINNYYRTQTNGLLPSVVSQLGLKAGDKSALVDAVYFHGSWAVPFAIEDTAQGVFRGDGGDVAMAFMRRDDLFQVQRGQDYDAIVIPYQSSYDLVVIKPSDTAARARLEGLFSNQLLTDIVNESQPEFVRLMMPRVEVEGRLESNLFGQSVADNASREGAFLGAGLESRGALIQRAVVSFDENGTSATFPDDGVDAIVDEFPLDRPYLFAVRESSTGYVLLAGRVNRF